MIIVDYSTVSIGNYLSMRLPPDIGLLRHTILNSLRSYNLKFRAKYGEMVIACDANTWRRDYFEYYKFKRREAREERPPEEEADWKLAYECFDQILQEIIETMPWKVVKVRGAESDDIIAVLTQKSQEFGSAQPVVVVASDSDYKQLLKYSDVKVWSPITKKFVEEKEPAKWLFEATLKGQSKDGIPSIYSADDYFLTREKGHRQPSIGKKKLDALYESYKAGKLADALTERERRNWDRNETLMSFDKIPPTLQNMILEAYKAAPTPHASGILNYLIRNKCKILIDQLNDFTPGKVLA